MTFLETKRRVHDRGVPPDSFLTELITWARTAPAEVFDTNAEPGDIYGDVKPILGPWIGDPGSPERLLHRKAVMCEVLRCLAGFEASWNWGEGVDRTNAHSLSHKVGEEAGIFQTSEDSEELDGPATALRDCVIRYCGNNDVQNFIDTMKTNHTFALEYCARLLRFSYQWDGPIKRHEIDSSLSIAAVDEFMHLLA
jgi:hypothetical protein